MNLFREHILSLPALIEEVFPIFKTEAERVFDGALCQSLTRLYTIGCGDSHHACEATELAFELLSGVATEPMMAMQFARYAMAAAFPNPQSPIPNPPAAVIGVSVSGGVTRTIEGVLRAAQRGMMTLAITSSNATPIAKAAQRVLTTRVPDVPNAQGVQVPGSRSFFASLVMLYLSAIRLGEMRGNLSVMEAEGWRGTLLACADAIRETVRLSDAAARELAEQTLDAREFVFCGSGPNRASALFSAAKILEASGDPAVAQDVEEWAHLQYFAKTANTPTFLISAGERDASRAEEVRVAMEAIGRRVICVSPKLPGNLRYAACDELFAPLVATIPTMLFAAYRAELKGEPYFRNFGGGRSIENGGGISRIRTSELVV